MLPFIKMLRYRRPAKSRSELKFINKFIVPLGAVSDEFGNLVVEVGESKVLWSCHTDTVHRIGGTQSIVINNNNVVGLSKVEKDSNCLGADCTTGVFIMAEMIKAKVPGTYVFHREEESGGKGSRFIETNKKDWLRTKKFAIAFDRRGKTSVITHQGGTRGASREFVESIVPMLPAGYQSDTGGIFTDTANYTDYIPECTNLSVGYNSEHTQHETQSLSHLDALLSCMVKFDESKLVAHRDPTKREFMNTYYGDSGYSNGFRYSNEEIWDDYPTKDYYKSVISLVKNYPEDVASFLEELGMDFTSLKEYIYKTRGWEVKC